MSDTAEKRREQDGAFNSESHPERNGEKLVFVAKKFKTAVKSNLCERDSGAKAWSDSDTGSILKLHYVKKDSKIL